jgi:hypothetical protein
VIFLHKYQNYITVGQKSLASPKSVGLLYASKTIGENNKHNDLTPIEL